MLWGSDYPHIEVTFGHTQQTLHKLFGDVDEKTKNRIMFGAFNQLFRDAPMPPSPGTRVGDGNALADDDHR